MRIERFEPAVARSGPDEGSLFRDYALDPGRVAPLFAYDPADPRAIDGRAVVLAARGAPPALTRLAGALRGYARRIGAGPAAARNLAAMERGEALLVTAGQQPGLLTGPLFTVYKAVTAVSLARRLADVVGRPVVPLFWTVSDDHDWDEVAGVTLVGPSGDLRRRTLPPPAEPGRPFGRIPVPAEAAAIVADVAAWAGRDGRGPYPHTEDVARFLNEAARDSASLSEWFDRIMARLFREEGLVMVDPLLPEVAEAGAVFLGGAARRAAAVAAALAEGARRMEALGYPVAFPPGDHALLFVIRNGARVGLRWDGGGFVSRKGDLRLSAADAAALAESDPASISPGAALRPPMRDALLPTLCHVAGPGEVAYLGQLAPVYEALGVGMPVIRPRQSLTLVPPEVSALLRRHGLTLAGTAGGLGEALNAALAGDGGPDLPALFGQAREGIEAAHGRLVQGLHEAGIDLSDLAAGNIERIFVQLGYLEGKARQRLREAHAGLVADFRRAEATLFPGGRAQEKVLNVVPWLLRAGWGLAAELLRAPLQGAHHWVIWGQDGEDQDLARRGRSKA